MQVSEHERQQIYRDYFERHNREQPGWDEDHGLFYEEWIALHASRRRRGSQLAHVAGFIGLVGSVVFFWWALLAGL